MGVLEIRKRNINEGFIQNKSMRAIYFFYTYIHVIIFNIVINFWWNVQIIKY